MLGMGLKKMMMIRRMGGRFCLGADMITIGLLPWRISALTLRQLIRTLYYYLSLPSTKNYVTNVTLPGARPDYLCRGNDVT